MSFHVGQKVVCVDGTAVDWCEAELFAGCRGPVQGTIYTVHGILPPKRITDGYSLFLEEIVNPPYFYDDDAEFGECAFRHTRFRPVIERKTDISIFEKMLPPVGPRVLEPVER